MSERLDVPVTFDPAKGHYVASVPDLPAPISALSLTVLRARSRTPTRPGMAAAPAGSALALELGIKNVDTGGRITIEPQSDAETRTRVIRSDRTAISHHAGRRPSDY
jgi:hypothetical protein